MLDEQKLRAKLAEVLKRDLPTRPFSFAKADALIDEIVEAATVKKRVRKKKPKPKLTPKPTLTPKPEQLPKLPEPESKQEKERSW